MGVPKAKKHKPLTSTDYRKGREQGMYDTLVLFFALMMQDDGWDVEKVARFAVKVMDWKSYAYEPNLKFYISSVEKILWDNGVHIERDL